MVDNVTIDPNEDKVTKKVLRDGTRVEYVYDGGGNVIQKASYVASENIATQTDTYEMNYQDQIGRIRRNGQVIAEYGYDANRQRVYRKVTPGAGVPDSAVREAQAGRITIWDGSGHQIGEAEANTGRVVVRYVYSGNEKVAMERVESETGARKWYYFINNTQGTPMMIVDEVGAICRSSSKIDPNRRVKLTP